ncbi:tetratricopeptide repeat protein [Micromonosporaceae bacterium B7E4]
MSWVPQVTRARPSVRGWRTLADEVLAAAEQSGERAAAAYARTALGGAAYRRGDIDGCLAHGQAALEYFRSVADHSRQARLHNLMAVALGDRGWHAEQKQHLYRAYELRTLAGNVRSQAVVLANLGELHNATGQYATARSELERAFDLVDAVRDPSFGLHCHHHLGCAYAGLGDDRLAAEQYHRALRLARQLGDHYLTGHTLRGLAALERKSGDAGRAELLLREALLAYRTSRDRQEIAQTLAELAVLRDGVAVGTAFVELGGLSA